MAEQEVKRQECEREMRRRRREGQVAATSPNPQSQSPDDQSATTYDMEPINPYRSPRLASLAFAAEHQKLQSLAGEDRPSQPESSRRTLSPKRGSSAAGKAGNAVQARSGSVRSSPRTSAVATSSPSSSSSRKPKSTATAIEALSPSGSSPKKSPRGGVPRIRCVHLLHTRADHPQEVFCFSVAIHVFRSMCI